MNTKEWEAFLLGATEEVRRRLSPLASRGGRGRTVGVGAAGDRTIYADRLAEDTLLDELRKVGGVKVLSEEAGDAGEAEGGTLAVVDPLDGSSNFERGIPFFCTSVAVVEAGTLDSVTVGVVRDLVTGDVYSARRGGGARKNGRAIRTSKAAEVAEAVVGVDLSRGPPGLAEGLAPLLGRVKRQVHLGANALEMCYLAEGKTDAFVDLRGTMRITDFAAAYLIAAEAGAVVTDGLGGKLSPEFDLAHRFSFVASANPAVHREILRLCRGWVSAVETRPKT
ncbi:MAG: fructose 1,6-bisphosphatase [Nitrososphaerota archaeon]|jgi:myo-inositol-1(or 4)-monophosphatase|nr:fructose 1,6-bisphosphatase [Nitrososphaerota archaeon]MDG6941891.1 fructose 1,6-bisphosphatase [Nitrososphaerota archaeon]MDG6946936.1 fructose 1,6-bisphosphatase [Nitrososphaerota archaeon]MDG6950653.1 fructose 1,6-bisphosphatase [Nitrososphaerota archaeon]